MFFNKLFEGARKKTLGDITPTSGEIFIDNVEVTNLSTHARSALVARVFQDPMIGTFADLTLEENMSVAGKRGAARGLSPALNKDLRIIFETHLRELEIDLENRLKDKASSLSGGQRQALSLVMATLQESKILLLDEHTSALDPKIGHIIMNLTGKIIKNQRLTALMITHSMTQALDYGNRTIMMYHGEIVRDMIGGERTSLTPSDLIKYFDL